jgi:hypothetical protein
MAKDGQKWSVRARVFEYPASLSSLGLLQETGWACQGLLSIGGTHDLTGLLVFPVTIYGFRTAARKVPVLV